VDRLDAGDGENRKNRRRHRRVDDPAMKEGAWQPAAAVAAHRAPDAATTDEATSRELLSLNWDLLSSLRRFLALSRMACLLDRNA